MECVGGAMGLLALALAMLCTAGTALVLGFVPQERERRRRLERAQFLRAHLLSQMALVRGCLSPRDRAMSPEQGSMIDGLIPLTVQADVLDVEEWQAILQAQAALVTAKHRLSYNKREARVAERTLDHAMAVLQAHVLNGHMTRSNGNRRHFSAWLQPSRAGSDSTPHHPPANQSA